MSYDALQRKHTENPFSYLNPVEIVVGIKISHVYKTTINKVSDIIMCLPATSWPHAPLHTTPTSKLDFYATGRILTSFML